MTRNNQYPSKKLPNMKFVVAYMSDIEFSKGNFRSNPAVISPRIHSSSQSSPFIRTLSESDPTLWNGKVLTRESVYIHVISLFESMEYLTRKIWWKEILKYTNFKESNYKYGKVYLHVKIFIPNRDYPLISLSLWSDRISWFCPLSSHFAHPKAHKIT